MSKTRKIEGLTAAQESRLAEYRGKWIAIGRSTEPADKQRAHKGVLQVYHRAGLSPPHIVWCGSPLANGMTRAILLGMEHSVRDSVRDSVWDSVWSSVEHSVGDSVRDSVWDSVRDSVRDSVGDSVGDSVRGSVRDSVWDSVGDSAWGSVWDSVGDSVWGSVRDSVWDSVGNSVRDSVWDSVGNSVRDSVWDSVWSSVWNSVGNSVGDSVRDSVRGSVRDSVWDSVRGSVRDSVWDSVGNSVGGQHDAHWLAFYEYFHNVIGLKPQTVAMSGLWEVAKSAGWFLPHQNMCWISERHNLLQFDSENRLHSLEGASVAYPDGWEIYSVHGVCVPKYIVMQSQLITAKEVLAEENAEVRRIMVDQMGPEKFVHVSGAKEVGVDDFGTLYTLPTPEGRTLDFVKVINSTPEPDGSSKHYFLRVPPGMRTAHAAVARTFGRSAQEYAPAIET